MAKCDWCGLHFEAEAIVPVRLSRHAGVDGEPSAEEPRENPLPTSPRSFGECCSFCFEQGYYRHPPQFWLAEERKRAERAGRSIREQFGPQQEAHHGS